MKVFLDTEFTELKRNCGLISLGLVAESGITFYAEFRDTYNKDNVSDFVKENVLPNLIVSPDDFIEFDFAMGSSKSNLRIYGDKSFIREKLEEWLDNFDTVEIWSDCLAYDWVLFCDIFGGALNLPLNVYYIPFDICTMFKLKGIDPDIPREKFLNVDSMSKHNALHDAKVIKDCYLKLSSLMTTDELPNQLFKE